MLEAAIAGIKERGKATTGEKTMLDALVPAYEAFQDGAKTGKPVIECLELACEAAKQGVEFTKTIIATKGRASYLGERSRGHQDPGATSSYIMLKALLEHLRR
jgi:dihydroxyacetone kinase-like protein